MLSNQVWNLFLSRIDEEINGEAWEFKVTNGGEREKSTLSFFHELNDHEEGESRWKGMGKV